MNYFFDLLEKFEDYRKYILLILLIGTVIYFPIFFNGFVWDDLDFIINNPEVHHLDIPSLLGPNMFNSGPFYRPIPAIYFASLYSLFNDQAFYYHAIQLLLHFVGTTLLFIFLSRFFKQGIAFFLSLVFLVHPINVESVAYIGSTQSELYFIPGILALILSKEKHLSRTRFLCIVGLLAMSAFTKETGALFFALVIAYRYLFKLEQIKTFIAAGGVLTIIYLIIRVLVLGDTYTISENISIASLSLMERLLNMPSVFVYYIKTFIYPVNLIVWQQWVIKEATTLNFLIPIVVSCVFSLFLLVTALLYLKSAAGGAENVKEHAHVKHETKKYSVIIGNKWISTQSFLFFMFWFVIGMGLIMQLVPLDMTVADRWFYFPIVGLLGMIGVILQSIQASPLYKGRAFLVLAIIILSVLSLRTFGRTFDYKNNLTLYSHDLKEENSQNYMMMGMYAKELWLVGKEDESMAYLNKSLSIFPSFNILYNLGYIYEMKNQPKKALDAYSHSIELYEKANVEVVKKGKAYPAYVRKLDLLTSLHRNEQKINFIKNKALKKYPNEPILYYELALTAIELNDRQLALDAAKRAHELQPEDAYYAEIYNALLTTDDWSKLRDEIRAL